MLIHVFLGKHKNLKIALIGFQPAFAKHLSKRHELRILDLDKENIGKDKYGVIVLDGNNNADEVLEWCDLALVTGTTVVNGTIESILEKATAKVIFYGISIAGVAQLFDFNRFCPRSV